MGRAGIVIGRIAGGVGALAAVTLLFRLGYYDGRPPGDTVWTVVTVVAALGLASWIWLDWEAIAEASGQRATRKQAASWLAVFMALGVVVMANYVAARHPASRDLTQAKIHTLSEQTTDVVGKLDRDVAVTAFFRAGGEAGAPGGRDAFISLMERYERLSPHLKVELVDPEAAPWAAQQKGVVQDGTVFVASGAREEKVVAPGESDLTNSIIKVTREGKKTVYFTTGHGERGLEESAEQGFSQVAEALRKQGYEVKALDLFQSPQVPEDADVVVVAGPTKPFSESDRRLLTDHLARNRGLLLMLDPGVDHGLADLARRFGIEARGDLALDPNGGRLGADYTYVVGVDYPLHDITERLSGIATVFPVATSLAEIEAAPAGVVRSPLVRSSDAAYGKADLQTPDPSFVEGRDHAGPLALAMLASIDPRAAGLVTPPPPEGGSSGAGTEETPTPDGASRAEIAPGGEVPADPAGDGAGEASALRATLAVFGDSDFASNALAGFGANADLFQNAVSYLAREGDLLSIRPKEAGHQPLSLTGPQLMVTILLGVLLVPGLAVAGGVGAWLWRRGR